MSKSLPKIVVSPLKKKAPIPHKNAKLVLIGLTPGKRQHIAINEAADPRFAAFKGQMRGNIYKWFELLDINSYFGIEDIDSLYVESRFDKIVYTTSLLRDPVYKNGANYTGRGPYPWQHPALTKMMNETFDRLSYIKTPCLIVPLGEVVSQAITEFSELHEKHFILHGFPHPSGLNGHKDKKFDENFESMKSNFRKFQKVTKKLVS